MVEMIKKAALIGAGLGLIAKENIENLAKRLSEEASMSESEGRKFVGDMLHLNDEAKKAMTKNIQEAINDAIEKLHIVTNADLQRLDERLSAVELEIVHLNARLPKHVEKHGPEHRIV